MMFTEVENAFGAVLLPFKAKRRGFIAKFQILRLPTVRAGHIETHEMRRLVGRFFDLAGAFDFRRRAANGFWPYRALNTLIPQQGWRALFQHPVRTRKARHSRPRPRIFHGSFWRLHRPGTRNRRPMKSVSA
ncbi:hypothetical protein ECDEC11A_1229 [Escherichia coli DEC11A]|nr:hypothetical protein ECDEC11A_1229 [Escherichia coli DEC11A]